MALKNAVLGHLEQYEQAAARDQQSREQIMERVFSQMDELFSRAPVEVRMALQIMMVTWRGLEAEYNAAVKERNELLKDSNGHIADIFDRFEQMEQQLELRIKTEQSN